MRCCYPSMISSKPGCPTSAMVRWWAVTLKVQEFGGSNLSGPQWSTPSQFKINFCTSDSNNCPKSSVSRTWRNETKRKWCVCVVILWVAFEIPTQHMRCSSVWWVHPGIWVETVEKCPVILPILPDYQHDRQWTHSFAPDPGVSFFGSSRTDVVAERTQMDTLQTFDASLSILSWWWVLFRRVTRQYDTFAGTDPIHFTAKMLPPKGLSSALAYRGKPTEIRMWRFT